MVMITREQALCMIHCAPYNNENAKKYAEMVDNLENLEICYIDDPMESKFLNVCELASLSVTKVIDFVLLTMLKQLTS
ncbi:hypothetical protein INT48_004100 [Thamnidium elegans]|uniref:Uncharacterized protein n=1 Tax=Thamnidium elegans TaxID=101142 RepID=A0A8H7SFC5_9FUNG|nr:hypothetical protein INT48_004100 [Thamnidium elegans]